MNPILIDVSRWQGQMDWEVAFNAGARAAILRAGSIDNGTGDCFKDSQFDNNTANAPNFMPVAYYWYFRPNHDPIKQANFFSDLVSPTSFFHLFADVETTGGLQSAQLTDTVARFVNKLRQNFGSKVGIYTRASFWNPFIARKNLWSSLDLWIARYIRIQESPWSDSESLRPLDWNDWKIWQFSADGNFRGAEFGAESKHIDVNIFNGDFSDLSEYCSTEISPVVAPEPRPEPEEETAPRGVCRVTAPAINLRSNASALSSDIGDLVEGTKLYWYEPVEDAAGNGWLRVGPSMYIAETFAGNRLVVRE
ncbi:MAG: glycoside hydrolase family 25 protein [Anaerolineales bacterium]|jgi:GH25 family lysozyme M1 (1,4-beta-N-acetylmuramidase)